MKKNYFSPEVVETPVMIERNILSNYTSSSADMDYDDTTYSGIEWI